MTQHAPGSIDPKEVMVNVAHPPAQDAPEAMTVILADQWEPCSPSYIARGGDCVNAPRVWDAATCNHWHPKLALDPSPPLPEADGDVVAWAYRTKDATEWQGAELREPNETQRAYWDLEPLVRQSALVSALRERDEARAQWAIELDVATTATRHAAEDRAARQKAEQVAAGLREGAGKLVDAVQNAGYSLGTDDRYSVSIASANRMVDAARHLLAALRASTEEGTS